MLFGILEFNFAPYTSTFFPSDASFPNQRTFTFLTPGVVYTFVVHDLFLYMEIIRIYIVRWWVLWWLGFGVGVLWWVVGGVGFWAENY